MFDFTTIYTNLANKTYTSICELSLVEYVDGSIKDKRTWLIKPEPMKFSATKTFETGIKIKSFEDKLLFYEVWHEVKPYLEQKTIVGFNIDYIIKQIYSTFAYYKNKQISSQFFSPEEEFPNFDYLCSFLILRKISAENLRSNKLDEICNLLGYKVDKTDSLSMALGSGFLFNTILKNIEFKDFLELKHKLGISLGETWRYSNKPFKPCVLMNQKYSYLGIDNFNELSKIFYQKNIQEELDL